MKTPSLGLLTHTLIVATMAMAEVRFKTNAAKLLKVGHTRCRIICIKSNYLTMLDTGQCGGPG